MNNTISTHGVNSGDSMQTHLANEENPSTFEGRTVSQAPADARYKAFPDYLGLEFKENTSVRGIKNWVCHDGKMTYRCYPEGKMAGIESDFAAEANYYSLHEAHPKTYTYQQDCVHEGISFGEGFFRVSHDTLFECIIDSHQNKRETFYYARIPEDPDADKNGFIEIDPETEEKLAKKNINSNKENKSSEVAQVLRKGKYGWDTHTYAYKNEGEISLRGEALPAGFYYSPETEPYTVYRYSLEDKKTYRVFLDAGEVKEIEYDFDTRELLWEGFQASLRNVKIGNDSVLELLINKGPTFYKLSDAFRLHTCTTQFVAYQAMGKYGNDLYPLEHSYKVKYIRREAMLYLWYPEGKPYRSNETNRIEMEGKPALVAVDWPMKKEYKEQYYRSLGYKETNKVYDYKYNPLFLGIKFPSGFYYELNRYTLYRFDSETNTHYKIIFDNELEIKYSCVKIDPETDLATLNDDSF